MDPGGALHNVAHIDAQTLANAVQVDVKAAEAFLKVVRRRSMAQTFANNLKDRVHHHGAGGHLHLPGHSTSPVVPLDNGDLESGRVSPSASPRQHPRKSAADRYSLRRGFSASGGLKSSRGGGALVVPADALAEEVSTRLSEQGGDGGSVHLPSSDQQQRLSPATAYLFSPKVAVRVHRLPSLQHHRSSRTSAAGGPVDADAAAGGAEATMLLRLMQRVEDLHARLEEQQQQQGKSGAAGSTQAGGSCICACAAQQRVESSGSTAL